MYKPEIMKLALNNALKVAEDIPVCALVVLGDDIISLQVNRKERDNQVTSHAEILALSEANKKLNSWRLNNCDMYVTLEPCPMCAWAIINTRISNLYFASYDLKYGAFGGAFNINQYSDFKVNVSGGLMEKEGDELLKKYFSNMRKTK